MARGLFGRRKEGQAVLEPNGWPQLPGAAESPPAPALGPPALAYMMAATPEAPAITPEAHLLERIAGLRGAVADQLYEISSDYRMLCDMTHAGLEACDDIIEELRRRLSDDVHYAVLAKLDEACALVERNLAGGSTPDEAR